MRQFLESRHDPNQSEGSIVCGLTGYWTKEPLSQGIECTVRSMAATLAHRGPDDTGIWFDKGAGVALAHRRLSILDLSPAGHQPMVSASGALVAAFNGEIYNHLDLRTELEAQRIAPVWRGHSDTETLLASFEAWGVEKTLKKCVGMFALALWDRKTRTLTLARDRLGEKPLYYGWVNGVLVFASELKAIRIFPEFCNAIDRRALTLFVRHNYIPAPWSIYEGIWKVLPGSWVRFTADSIASATRSEVRTYWSTRIAAETGLSDPFRGSDEEAIEELNRRLRQSIAGQMVADVPLGAFLSGGIDSSTVVALMQAQTAQPVKTFTIGFHEGEYNEAEHAKAVARCLGTDHTELYVTPTEAMEVIPTLPTLYDEPFADSSQIPTFLVARLARQHVTVALSGDGGDELFGGYNRYFWAMTIWRCLSGFPLPLRRGLGGLVTSCSPTAWNRLFELFGPVLPKRFRHANSGDKLHKLARLFATRTPESIYLRLVSHWDVAEGLIPDAAEPLTPITDPTQWLDCSDFEHRMMHLDMVSYLPDDILTKVDRSAMGVSMETRVPMLDHRVLEFAWRLPLKMKIRHGQGKWILRQLLHRYVPQDLVERPKMGFGIPIDRWLRGPLREWAEDLLAENRLRREGFFDSSPVRQKWHEHLSGQRNWAYYLWDILMFEAWRDHYDA